MTETISSLVHLPSANIYLHFRALSLSLSHILKVQSFGPDNGFCSTLNKSVVIWMIPVVLVSVLRYCSIHSVALLLGSSGARELHGFSAGVLLDSVVVRVSGSVTSPHLVRDQRTIGTIRSISSEAAKVTGFTSVQNKLLVLNQDV